jgi:hypothetical protein
MKIRQLSALALLAAALVACSEEYDDDGNPRPVDTGVRGVVLRGPIEPACGEGQACEDQPFEADFAVTRDGRPITSFRSAADGTFEVPLAPGAYRVTPAADAPILAPATQAKDVTVVEGTFTEVEWHFDTGIR